MSDDKSDEPGDELDDAELSDADLSAALAGLKGAAAPTDFGPDLENKIRERSAGRFFGNRTLADVLPASLVALVALVIVGLLYWFVWSSDPGPLEPFDQHPTKPDIAPGAKDVIPHP